MQLGCPLKESLVACHCRVTAHDHTPSHVAKKRGTIFVNVYIGIVLKEVAAGVNNYKSTVI